LEYQSYSVLLTIAFIRDRLNLPAVSFRGAGQKLQNSNYSVVEIWGPGQYDAEEVPGINRSTGTISDRDPLGTVPPDSQPKPATAVPVFNRSAEVLMRIFSTDSTARPNTRTIRGTGALCSDALAKVDKLYHRDRYNEWIDGEA